MLFGLLLVAFVPSGPLILGTDDTTLRRTGAKISAKSIYRDPVIRIPDDQLYIVTPLMP